MSSGNECRVYERIAAGGVEGGFVRPGGAALTERALSLCGLGPGSRLLDVGCGTGATVELLGTRQGFRAVGIDPSLPMTEMGRGRNQSLRLLVASGEDVPFADAEWDGVLIECSLSLTRDHRRVLRECCRVLRNGGKLILNDVYVRNEDAVRELRGLSLDCCVGGALTREELLSALEDCGFTVLAWEDHSAALKVFAAQLILSGRLPGSFWCSLTGVQPRDGVRIEQVVAGARLGYFLAIAEKPKDAGPIM